MDKILSRKNCQHQWKWIIKNHHRICKLCKLNQKGYTIFAKSDCLIPSRFAIGMVDRGYILRNEIIWEKSNCMPSSASDRFTINFEKIFFFVKEKKYWFETQYEPHKLESIRRACRARTSHKLDAKQYAHSRKNENIGYDDMMGKLERGELSYAVSPYGRNKRCIWDIPTKPFKESHFAVFPPNLIRPMVQAGCPQFICKKCGKAREKIFGKGNFIQTGGSRIKQTPGLSKNQKEKAGYNTSTIIGLSDCKCNADWNSGIVLDPFMGAGTTAVVAKEMGRNYIGIELSPQYCKMAEKRIKNTEKSLFYE